MATFIAVNLEGEDWTTYIDVEKILSFAEIEGQVQILINGGRNRLKETLLEFLALLDGKAEIIGQPQTVKDALDAESGNPWVTG